MTSLLQRTELCEAYTAIAEGHIKIKLFSLGSGFILIGLRAVGVEACVAFVDYPVYFRPLAAVVEVSVFPENVNVLAVALDQKDPFLVWWSKSLATFFGWESQLLFFFISSVDIRKPLVPSRFDFLVRVPLLS